MLIKYTPILILYRKAVLGGQMTRKGLLNILSISLFIITMAATVSFAADTAVDDVSHDVWWQYAKNDDGTYTLYLGSKNAAVAAKAGKAANNFSEENQKSAGLWDEPPWALTERSTFTVSQVEIIDKIYPLTTCGWFTSNHINVSDDVGSRFCCTSIDLINLDTSYCTNMRRMFMCTYPLETLDVSHFDTSSCIYMDDMFYLLENVETLDVSNFDTSNVTGMSCMFACCVNLKELDVSNFNTENVTVTQSMFWGLCKVEELDLTNWDVSNVTQMAGMFEGCHSLRTIKVRCGIDWTTKNRFGTDMFKGCRSLRGGNGTRVSSSYLEMARVDGLNGRRGYFTIGNHEYTIIKGASCTEKGIRSFSCALCTDNETITEEYILSHDMTEHPAVPATCTTDGNSAYWYCSECRKYYSDRYGDNEIDESSWVKSHTGHQWDQGVITTPPSTTAKGVKIYTCTSCWMTRTEDIPPTPDYSDQSRQTAIVQVPTLSAPKLKCSAKKKKIKLSWNMVSGASGYQLYIKYPGSKKYVLALNKDASVKSVTHKGLTRKKKYSYKLRAFVVTNGQYYYGPFSKAKTAKVK